MESKVLLFDANNTKVGETFMRRARQLVSSQRAEWTDEHHTAIRFAADAEDLPIPVADTASTPPAETADEAWIYAAAERQIKERRNFIMHSIGFVPGIFALFLITTAIVDQIMIDAEYFFIFTLGGWCTAYGIHLWFFARKRLKNFRLLDTEKRKAYRLNAEVERIRRGISG
ncbi:MAG: 2TM domain-containing protein [Clostridiales bacterium]|jgi:hypothetical protein|nr:2TM domain-containing protein [Clostridiales bacterium]